MKVGRANMLDVRWGRGRRKKLVIDNMRYRSQLTGELGWDDNWLKEGTWKKPVFFYLTVFHGSNWIYIGYTKK